MRNFTREMNRALNGEILLNTALTAAEEIAVLRKRITELERLNARLYKQLKQALGYDEEAIA